MIFEVRVIFLELFYFPNFHILFIEVKKKKKVKETAMQVTFPWITYLFLALKLKVWILALGITFDRIFG
jgi:hypothetical protein